MCRAAADKLGAVIKYKIQFTANGLNALAIINYAVKHKFKLYPIKHIGGHLRILALILSSVIVAIYN